MDRMPFQMWSLEGHRAVLSKTMLKEMFFYGESRQGVPMRDFLEGECVPP